MEHYDVVGIFIVYVQNIHSLFSKRQNGFFFGKHPQETIQNIPPKFSRILNHIVCKSH
jgi:hypothetical protein